MSMFGYNFDHPNFMPVTRDLSPDKTEIVRKWLVCEINGSVKSNQKRIRYFLQKKILRLQLVQNVLQIKKQAMLFAIVALTTLEQDGILYILLLKCI